MRRALAGAVAGVVLLVPGAPGHAAEDEPDLAALQAELAAVTVQAQSLADELAAASSRDGALRVALQRLAVEQDRQRVRVDAQVRRAFMRSGGVDPLAGWQARVAPPSLRARAQAAVLRAERALVRDADREAGRLTALRARAARARAALVDRAAPVLAAQERARSLLARAEAKAHAEQQAAALAQLAATRRALDAVSASVTTSLTPAQTRRSLRAQAAEAPVVALVEAAGAGYPQGYQPTGQVLRGVASWYGPGFVGNPTASGSPYDPERLTCAHKSLKLGTVVRISRGDRAVSCLVNDRGPYVGARIIDLSRAGSRLLGFDGIAEVVVEVLAPTA